MTTQRTYSELSRIFYNHVAKTARLFEENPGTAKLLEHAESNGSILKGLEYEEFCDVLCDYIYIPRGNSFSVDGKSANWIAVYQFIHNGRVWSEFLLKVLEALETAEKKPVLQLPVTPPVIEELDLDEEVKNNLVEDFWQVYLFKQVLNKFQ